MRPNAPEAVRQYTEAFKDQGITIVNESPNVLHARFFTLTGSPMTFKSGKEEASMSSKYPGHDIRLTIDGNEIWKQVYDKAPEMSGRTFGPTIIWVNVHPGESLQAAIDREHPAPKFLPTPICPPAYVFKDRPIGSTEIGPHGIVAAPALPGVRPRPAK